MKNIDKIIEDGTDEDVLKAFYKFFKRVNIKTDFILSEDDLILGEVMVVNCGDSMFTSDPIEYPWPLQYMPMPDALKGVVN